MIASLLLLLGLAAASSHRRVQNSAVCLTALKEANSIDLSHFTPKETGIDTGAGCSNTSNNTVECCACLDDLLGFIDLDGCADLIIDWDELNVTFRLTLNSTILFESTFGFDTAPELCTDIWGLHICVYFEDMRLRDWTFEGCLHLIIDYSLDINLGCWSISKPE